MSCPHTSIPDYLHWKGRKLFRESDFSDKHYFYRVTKNGNPIEFPSIITSYSCKWSFLIKEVDVLISDVPPLGDSFKYAFIDSLRKYTISKQKEEGDNKGWHELTCSFSHEPNECDYSHCEVNIKHRIFKEKEKIECIFEVVYTHKMWEENKTLLQKSGAFYKNLRKDYRRDLIKTFFHPEE